MSNNHKYRSISINFKVYFLKIPDKLALQTGPIKMTISPILYVDTLIRSWPSGVWIFKPVFPFCKKNISTPLDSLQLRHYATSHNPNLQWRLFLKVMWKNIISPQKSATLQWASFMEYSDNDNTSTELFKSWVKPQSVSSTPLSTRPLQLAFIRYFSLNVFRTQQP